MPHPPVLPHAPGRRALALLLLTALLLPAPSAFAQTSTPSVQVSAPATLRITILEGDNALNNIRQRTAREPIVQVEDENHKPVAGVSIVFTSLRGPNGAGGTFNSLTSYKTVTNAQGKAVGRGFQPNTTTGNFTISVQAAAGTMMAAVIIHEQNTLPGGAGAGSSSLPASDSGFIHVFRLIPKWALVGAIVGGTAIGVAVATRTPTGATISSGGGTVTAPAAHPASR